jgi:hypothetical protein
LIVLIIFSSSIFFAQEIPELKTDRPDKTESASTVPSGSLQIETGFEHLRETYDDGADLSSLNAVGALFRYGILNDIELRFAGAFLSQEIRTITSNLSSDGMADFMIGAKYEFINDDETFPDFALMTHLFLPVGAETHRPGKVEPQVVLSLSKPFTELFSLGSNFGAHYNSTSENIFYFFTFAGGFGLTDELGAFVEIFSEIFSDTDPFYSLNAGFTYLVLTNLQMDISGGNGLFNNSKVWYLGTGITVRIPR